MVDGCLVDSYWFQWGRPLHTRSTLVCIEHSVAAPFLTWNQISEGEYVPYWQCDKGEKLNERQVRKHEWYESRHTYEGDKT